MNAFIAGSHGTGSEDGLRGNEGDHSLDSIFQGKFIQAAVVSGEGNEGLFFPRNDYYRFPMSTDK